MPSSETKWFCGKCNQAHPTEQQAAECEEKHYEVGQIVGVYYSPKKKCPKKIQVQILVGDDLKDVFYEVVEDGWGKN